MNDTRQLELNLIYSPVVDEYSVDQTVQLNLQRMRVRTYAHAVYRGHKAWANTLPPKTSEIRELLEWWSHNPNAVGTFLIPTLEQVLRERSQVVILGCRKHRDRMEDEERAQKVFITDLVRPL